MDRRSLLLGSASLLFAKSAKVTPKQFGLFLSKLGVGYGPVTDGFTLGPGGFWQAEIYDSDCGSSYTGWASDNSAILEYWRGRESVRFATTCTPRATSLT